MTPAPIATDIVLVGGGHAHLIVLRMFAMRPEPGVRLTLIAQEADAAYSGMLPGLVAGIYDRDAVHVDLVRLTGIAGARLIHGRVTGVDPVTRRVRIAGRPDLGYDLLSLDVGITPDLSGIRGAEAHAIPVKPVSGFAARWQALLDRREAARNLAVIGGGAAGVELALAVAARLTRAGRADPPAAQPSGGLALGGSAFPDTPSPEAAPPGDPAAGVEPVADPGDAARTRPPGFEPPASLPGSGGTHRGGGSVTLVAGSTLLPGFPAGARRLARAALARAGVRLVEGDAVAGLGPDAMHLASGTLLPCDAALVATGAQAPGWLGQTGLACDAQGFLAIGPTLQVAGTPTVFAAGDCASVTADPRPKAGVFAVRQGPVLAENLRRMARGEPLRAYRAQRQFLTLLSTGDGQAIATRGGLSAAGRWAFRWKDRIDRRFMARFNALPAMAEAPGDPPMRCGGCAAKLGPAPLARALARLGGEGRDDAAVIDTGGDHLRLETVDFFRAFWPDPYLLGEIAANHALGDILAMGGTADIAQAIGVLPVARPRIGEEDLYQLLSGARAAFDREGVRLVGGHTGEGAELSVGFAVSGRVLRGEVLEKRGLKAGDALILTRPLGTGILLAALMRGRAQGRAVLAALAEMRRSQSPAMAALRAGGVRAATDVTGFGLAGHLVEMLEASGVAASLDLPALPLYPQVAALARAGIASTLLPANLALADRLGLAAEPGDGPESPGRAVDAATLAILFDPQTAGGLLAAVPEASARATLDALRVAGFTAARIGQVTAGGTEPCLSLVGEIAGD